LDNSTGVISGQRGFSLLEMVVAVAILGMTLGVLYQASSVATRTIGLDEKMAYAVELARSLRAVHAVVPLTGVSADGETEGGFVWQVNASPIELPFELPLEEGQLQTLQIAITWPDGNKERSYALASVVAGRQDPL
jgi:general secretion pathway protein I